MYSTEMIRDLLISVLKLYFFSALFQKMSTIEYRHIAYQKKGNSHGQLFERSAHEFTHWGL